MILEIECFDGHIEAGLAMTGEEEGEPVKVRCALVRLL